MGELSHAQAHPFEDSFEACQSDCLSLATEIPMPYLVPTIDPIILCSKV